MNNYTWSHIYYFSGWRGCSSATNKNCAKIILSNVIVWTGFCIKTSHVWEDSICQLQKQPTLQWMPPSGKNHMKFHIVSSTSAYEAEKYVVADRIHLTLCWCTVYHSTWNVCNPGSYYNANWSSMSCFSFKTKDENTSLNHTKHIVLWVKSTWDQTVAVAVKRCFWPRLVLDQLSSGKLVPGPQAWFD